MLDSLWNLDCIRRLVFYVRFFLLKENGIPVIELSDYTGFPEMLDGRVKTLHPKVHGGLLYIRGNEKHEATVREHNILPIDLVVVNLYPFEQTISKPGVTLAEAIENIDIGGPCMLRASSKNFLRVAVLCDPADYREVLEELKRNNGALSLATRFRLGQKGFRHTADYDRAIADFLESRDESALSVYQIQNRG